MPESPNTNVWDADRLTDPHRQPDKAARVRSMFDAIAPTYELVNRLASLGQDARWRRAMVRIADVRPDDVLLDVACGTGDVARAFAAGQPAPARTIGCDFAMEMLRLARPRDEARLAWCQADGLALPVADETASIVSCAFGIRNFQSLDSGLREMWRVLRPGGRAIILEFSVPSVPVLRQLYLAYFTRVMPLAATVISRDRSGAYRYLPRSVVSFHDREGIQSCLVRAGFSRVDVFPLTFGIVSVYRATK
jgi:demethylmenaquinone methyltransferase/2-methoxy-6-polyprenyl-1,4-benzoquinol methylase